MAKINDLPILSNPTEDMYCLVAKEDLQKVPWSAIMGQIVAPYIATTVAGMTDKTLTQSDKPADSAIVGKEIGSLKESIKDIITKTPTEEKTDVEATEIINGSIILSSGNLSKNQYTTRFVVNRYDNVNRGKYEAHGYAQGNQCLYVVKKGDEVKAYQKVGDPIDAAGTKTLNLTIEEDGCTVYVGAYENIV